MTQWHSRLILSASLLTILIVANYQLTNCCSLSRGFKIKAATISFENGNAALSTDIDYHFSEAALTALDNGVSLPLNVELMVKSRRKWIWDKTEWRSILPYQIHYLALSKRYQVINELSGSKRSFASRKTAIEALGRIRAMPVSNSGCPSAKQQCALFMRVTLDRERLPLPLRVIAYTRLDWHLSSRWKQWPLIS